MTNHKRPVFHDPVLLNEVITGLAVAPERWYIDTTGGGGGHTQEILNKRGNVLAIDQDPDAFGELKRKFREEEKIDRVRIIQGNFVNLQDIVKRNLKFAIWGVLFDLGFSTHQVSSKRGFSFLRDSALDMRMGQSGQSANNIINTYSEASLYEVFRKLGEENLAWAIAHAIVVSRSIKPIYTTYQLKNIIHTVYKYRKTRTDQATKVFQALRIEVNQELVNLEKGLTQALDLLVQKGRLVVISYHSLEDRITKLFLRKVEKNKIVNILTHKPIRPRFEEIVLNRKARSAKLRIAEKI